MRQLVILACVIIYVAASPVKNEEINKKIEHASGEKASEIVFEISENEEESETAEGRDVIHLVKKDNNGAKAIHIHSPNPPDINIMPMKYQIAANQPQQPFPYTGAFFKPMRYGQQGVKYYRKKDKNKPERRNAPKNQVNIYVYFNNESNSETTMEEKNYDPKMPTGVPIKRVTVETPGTNPSIVSQGSSVSQGTSVPQGSSMPKQPPTLIAVCPKGHVKVLGACVEYDED